MTSLITTEYEIRTRGRSCLSGLRVIRRTNNMVPDGRLEYVVSRPGTFTGIQGHTSNAVLHVRPISLYLYSLVSDPIQGHPKQGENSIPGKVVQWEFGKPTLHSPADLRTTGMLFSPVS